MRNVAVFMCAMGLVCGQVPQGNANEEKAEGAAGSSGDASTRVPSSPASSGHHSPASNAPHSPPYNATSAHNQGSQPIPSKREALFYVNLVKILEPDKKEINIGDEHKYGEHYAVYDKFVNKTHDYDPDLMIVIARFIDHHEHPVTPEAIISFAIRKIKEIINFKKAQPNSDVEGEAFNYINVVCRHASQTQLNELKKAMDIQLQEGHDKNPEVYKLYIALMDYESFVTEGGLGFVEELVQTMSKCNKDAQQCAFIQWAVHKIVDQLNNARQGSTPKQLTIQFIFEYCTDLTKLRALHEKYIDSDKIFFKINLIQKLRLTDELNELANMHTSSLHHLYNVYQSMYQAITTPVSDSDKIGIIDLIKKYALANKDHIQDIQYTSVINWAGQLQSSGVLVNEHQCTFHFLEYNDSCEAALIARLKAALNPSAQQKGQPSQRFHHIGGQ